MLGIMYYPLLMLRACVLTTVPDFDNVLWVTANKQQANNAHFHAASSHHARLLQMTSPAMDVLTEHTRDESPKGNNNVIVMMLKSLSTPVEVVISMNPMCSSCAKANKSG